MQSMAIPGFILHDRVIGGRTFFRCVFFITALQSCGRKNFIPNSATIPAQSYSRANCSLECLENYGRLRRSPPRPCWCHMRCNLFVILIGAFLDVGLIYSAAAADLSPV